MKPCGTNKQDDGALFLASLGLGAPFLEVTVLFVENPFSIVILGAIACLTPLVLWTHTGHPRWMKLLIAGLCFFGALLAFERWYETDRESLYRTIYQYRDLVRKNEIAELMEHLHPDRRAQVSHNLGKYQFLDCNVSQLSRNPVVSNKDGKVVAEIEFLATARVADFGTGGPVRIRLRMEKTGPGTWMVTGVSHALLGSDHFDDSFRNL
ncbi:MAG: hypothetical protein Q8M16_19600 [Pirellulaceae bacterium]|nr:hypothetical protein [Pirellulaceae bacterium]